MAHGVEVVLAPAVHARRDEGGREDVDRPADVIRVIEEFLQKLVALPFF